MQSDVFFLFFVFFSRVDEYRDTLFFSPKKKPRKLNYIWSSKILQNASYSYRIYTSLCVCVFIYLYIYIYAVAITRVYLQLFTSRLQLAVSRKALTTVSQSAGPFVLEETLLFLTFLYCTRANRNNSFFLFLSLSLSHSTFVKTLHVHFSLLLLFYFSLLSFFAGGISAIIHYSQCKNVKYVFKICVCVCVCVCFPLVNVLYFIPINMYTEYLHNHCTILYNSVIFRK